MDAHLPAHHLPVDIERTSLSILNAELEAQGVRLSGPCAPVIPIRLFLTLPQKTVTPSIWML